MTFSKIFIHDFKYNYFRQLYLHTRTRPNHLWKGAHLNLLAHHYLKQCKFLTSTGSIERCGHKSPRPANPTPQSTAALATSGGLKRTRAPQHPPLQLSSSEGQGTRPKQSHAVSSAQFCQAIDMFQHSDWRYRLPHNNTR